MESHTAYRSRRIPPSVVVFPAAVALATGLAQRGLLGDNYRWLFELTWFGSLLGGFVGFLLGWIVWLRVFPTLLQDRKWPAYEHFRKYPAFDGAAKCAFGLGGGIVGGFTGYWAAMNEDLNPAKNIIVSAAVVFVATIVVVRRKNWISPDRISYHNIRASDWGMCLALAASPLVVLVLYGFLRIRHSAGAASWTTEAVLAGGSFGGILLAQAGEMVAQKRWRRPGATSHLRVQLACLLVGLLVGGVCGSLAGRVIGIHALPVLGTAYALLHLTLCRILALGEHDPDFMSESDLEMLPYVALVACVGAVVITLLALLADALLSNPGRTSVWRFLGILMYTPAGALMGYGVGWGLFRAFTHNWEFEVGHTTGGSRHPKVDLRVKVLVVALGAACGALLGDTVLPRFAELNLLIGYPTLVASGFVALATLTNSGAPR